MGDVFDALKRARGKGTTGGPSAPAAAPPRPPQAESPAGVETGALPAVDPPPPEDSYNDEPAAPEQAGGLPGVSASTTGAAVSNGERAASGAHDRREHDHPASSSHITAPAALDRVGAAPADQAQIDSRGDSKSNSTSLLPAIGKAGGKVNGYAPDIIVHHDRGGIVTEQYRAIRTQILARGRNRRLQTHVLTSATPEEGKSVTVMNLGVCFAELRNHKTILVECDLRQPTFESLLERKIPVGMRQLLRGDVDDLDAVIQPSIYDNLQIITAGGHDPTHTSELLNSPRMAQILERLKDRYDHIFLDTPPVITVTDACILGAMCDQTYLVVRLNRTPADLCERAKRLLRSSNCEVSGVILTHLTQTPLRYLYRQAYYTYAYSGKT